MTGRLSGKPNVIVVGIDTLRADHLGCYGYARPTSPHLDQLAGESVVFRECFSTSSWTAPAWASMFTGRLPSQHRLVQYPRPGVLGPAATTLAEVLKQAGYVTAGFHGGGFVDGIFGLGRGFEEYESRGARFGDGQTACLRWLHRNRRWPLFLFWHGFDCHMPYEPPAEYDVFDPEYRGAYDVSKLYLPDGELPTDDADHQHVLAKYDGEIACVDAAVARLLYELETLQLLDRTLLVVVSDHGEEFLEHGCYDHTRTLYDELVRVPMLVRLPTGLERGSVCQLVSLADTAPMICEWLGLTFPRCHGQSLGRLREQPRSAVYAETGYCAEYLEETAGKAWQHKKDRPALLRSIRTPTWKLVIDARDRPAELYQMRQDTAERSSVLAEHPDVVGELMSVFNRDGPGVSADEIQAAVHSAPDADESVESRLRALGYL